MTDEQTGIDTKWLRTLHSLGVGSEFLKEIKRLLREEDLLNSPEWPELCQMGYALMPDQPLFESAKKRDRKKPQENKPKDKTEDEAGGRQSRNNNSELAKFRRMSRHPVGSKLLLARIYMELDDLVHAKPLIAAVFEQENEDYRIQARLLLQEIMMETNGEGFQNLPKDIDYDLTMRYRAFADMSNRFSMLSDDEVSQRVVMAQIYLELGDKERAEANIQRVLDDDQLSGKANKYLKEAIADELNDINKINKIAADANMGLIPKALLPAEDMEDADSGGRVMSAQQQRAIVKDVSSRFQALIEDDLHEKLAMASLYVDMQEFDLARALIADIKSRDDDEYTVLAQELLDKIVLHRVSN